MKTLNPVMVTAVGGLMAAVISAGVSYMVASQKQESEDSLARATLFTQLLTSIKASPEDPYPLLSLWKIYPDDRRLIVITALQAPSPKTIKLLSQLGYREELTDFQEDIRRIYEDAQGESRRTIGSLFQALDTIDQVDIVLDQLAGLSEITPNAPVVEELRELVQNDAKSGARVVDRLKTVPANAVSLQAAMALALYDAGNKAPFENLLARIGRDIGLFPQLSTYLQDRQPYSLDERLRSTMVGLAHDFSDHVNTTGGDYIVQNFAISSMAQFFPSVNVNYHDTDKFRDTLLGIARHETARASQRERALRTLTDNGFETDAVAAFLQIVVCDGTPDTRQGAYDRMGFAETFLESDIAFAQYRDALPALTGAMTKRGLTCDA